MILPGIRLYGPDLGWVTDHGSGIVCHRVEEMGGG